MGYACPVCATPQRDGEHLAHHLAFTAMIHGAEHEAWLDENAPGWAEQTPEGLAREVVDRAEETEYHEVFEDTIDRGRPDVDIGAHEGHGNGEKGGDRTTRGGVDVSTGTDPEAAAAIREARELTREMYADDNDDGDDGAEHDGNAATDGDTRA